MARGDALHDPTLRELVRVGNFKQALKNVDKKLKKHPLDTDLLILKADFLLRNEELDGCQKLLQNLTLRDPPISHSDDIGKVYAIGHGLFQQTDAPPPVFQLEDLWQKAIKTRSNPSDKQALAQRWLAEAIDCDLWSHVAKAAAVLYRLNETNKEDARQFYFLQIVAHWLTKPDPAVKDERMRSLSRQVAMRMLQKAVENSSDDPANTQTIRLTNSSQFALVQELYFRSERHDDLLQLLDSEHLTFSDSSELDEWEREQMRLQVLAKTRRKHGESCLEAATRLLTDALEKNVRWKIEDWSLYDVLVRHCESDQVQGVRTQLEEVVHRFPSARSPRLAQIQLAAKFPAIFFPSPSSSVDTTSTAVSTNRLPQLLLDYLQDFISTHEAAMEARLQFHQFSPEERTAFKNKFNAKLETSPPYDGRSQIRTDQIPLSSPDNLSQNLPDVKEALAFRRAELAIGLPAKPQEATEYLTEVLRLYRYLDVQLMAHNSSSSRDYMRQATILAAQICLQVEHQDPAVNQPPAQSTAATISHEQSPSNPNIASDLSQQLAHQSHKPGLLHAAFIIDRLHYSSATNSDINMLRSSIYISLGVPQKGYEFYQQIKNKEFLFHQVDTKFMTRIATLYPSAAKTGDGIKEIIKHLKQAEEDDRKLRKALKDLAAKNAPALFQSAQALQANQNSMTRLMLIFEARAMARLRGKKGDETFGVPDLDAAVDAARRHPPVPAPTHAPGHPDDPPAPSGAHLAFASYVDAVTDPLRADAKLPAREVWRPEGAEGLSGVERAFCPLLGDLLAARRCGIDGLAAAGVLRVLERLEAGVASLRLPGWTGVP
ncbi:MAG: hypothetical protein Q9162_007394, partial [Coniocarpon cinnabarinum]